MTDQPSGGGQDNSVPELKPLKFQLIADDGHVASYQALVGGQDSPVGGQGTPAEDQNAPVADQNAPDSAGFTVTVTIASSVQRGAEKDIQTLLGGMKAAFEILPGPPPDNGGSGDEEPSGTGEQPSIEELSDSKQPVRIEFSLANHGDSGPAGVAVTVQKTTGMAIEKYLPEELNAGLYDYWCVDTGQSINASVTVYVGTGTISPPSTDVYARPESYNFKAKKIIVHAGPNAITYSLTGSFWLAKHDV